MTLLSLADSVSLFVRKKHDVVMKHMSEIAAALCACVCVQFHRVEQNIATTELANLVYSVCNCVLVYNFYDL